MKIVPAERMQASGWLALRLQLWPACLESDSHAEIARILASPDECAFLAVADDGRVAGFAEISLRDYADGCRSSPVGFLEGIFVRPERRGCGIARRLVEAGESWAAAKGCREFGSDTRIDNEAGIRFHEALGFRESERQVVFLKNISGGAHHKNREDP